MCLSVSQKLASPFLIGALVGELGRQEKAKATETSFYDEARNMCVHLASFQYNLIAET